MDSLNEVYAAAFGVLGAGFDEDCDGAEALSSDCKKFSARCETAFHRLVAFIIFAIIASIPLYVMCCCSPPPVRLSFLMLCPRFQLC